MPCDVQCFALGRKNKEVLTVQIMAPSTFGKATLAYLVRDYSLDADQGNRIRVDITEPPVPPEQVSIPTRGLACQPAKHPCWLPVLSSIQINHARCQQRPGLQGFQWV